MKKYLKSLIPKDNPIYNFINSFRTRPINPFHETGFHGDPYLTSFVFSALKRSEQFIETGASVGSTLIHVAEEFKGMPIYSCEPDKQTYRFVSAKAAGYKNVILLKKTSPEFLYTIEKDDPMLNKRDTVFWLDSHAMGFKWPLKDEVAFATSRFSKGYIFIDDFLVPGSPQFGYDRYDGQTCSFGYIEDSLDKAKEYRIYYPSYRNAPGLYDPLRGWVLIEFGHGDKWSLPPELEGKAVMSRFTRDCR